MENENATTIGNGYTYAVRYSYETRKWVWSAHYLGQSIGGPKASHDTASEATAALRRAIFDDGRAAMVRYMSEGQLANRNRADDAARILATISPRN